MWNHRVILACCTSALVIFFDSRADAQSDVEFNRDVRPILAANCFECHGFDAKTRQADLRLDTAEGAYADHDGSVAVRSGDLAGSELWNRVSTSDTEVVMPPPEYRFQLFLPF
mgnify:FL=1